MCGGGVCFRKDSGFQCAYENVGIGRCHLCTHGCALFLDGILIVKSKNVFVENEYMEMGEDIARYLEVIDDQQKEVAGSKQQLAGCQTPVCNTGKKIYEVSPRHARRKLATFRILWSCS